MIAIEILIRIHPAKRTEWLLAFDMLKDENHQDNNRLKCELYEKVNEPNTFLWQEEWLSHDTLATYFEDNRFRVMMGAVDTLGELVEQRTFTVQ